LERRRRLVAAVRRGRSARAVARRFHVSLCTVQRWVARAAGRRLDRVDWAARPRGCRQAPRRTALDLEDLVLTLRRELKERSALGEYGAVAIHRALTAQGHANLPCPRTLARILERRGALDGQRRVRRSPPPKGWYLPDLAARQVELDSFDGVEGLVLRGGLGVEVLNGISLHGGLCASWPAPVLTAKFTAQRLEEHWRQFGLPAYAQFDNDTVFQGPHHWADTFGRVTRLCLTLGVVPVFTPPRETGFQAAIENYNGRWQVKVWTRFTHADRADLLGHSERFVAAARQASAARIEAAPDRDPFPAAWRLNLQAPLRGRVVFLRRTNVAGEVQLLGHAYAVDPQWPQRLVRAEVDLSAGAIAFHALRRRVPDWQPVLRQLDYQPPKGAFHD
jgi:hypothetical protein